MTSLSIWFWQRMVTPHMAFLAVSLADRGHQVNYVAERKLDEDREALGWQVPDLPNVSLYFASTAHEVERLVSLSLSSSVHLTQGFRSNGSVALAQRAIKARGRRHFVIMETVDRRGPIGALRRALYAWHLNRWRTGLDAVLAIGADTTTWVAQMAPANLKVFPFAYFLQDSEVSAPTSAGSPFRFLFVGALVARKRVDLLLRCLSELSDQSFEIEVIGDGPMRESLMRLAADHLYDRATFSGVVPMNDVTDYMGRADCLVLPSDHDGWGAVVSEALMAGTPVICSSSCGARDVVAASNAGGIFPTDNPTALRNSLASVLAQGKVTSARRERLRKWARSLGANAGAEYLETILRAVMSGTSRVAVVPWRGHNAVP